MSAVERRASGLMSLIERSIASPADVCTTISLGYRFGDFRLEVQMLNAFDEQLSDIQYFYGSRLQGEPVGGVEDVHFHPAEPRQFRVRLSWGL